MIALIKNVENIISEGPTLRCNRFNSLENVRKIQSNTSNALNLSNQLGVGSGLWMKNIGLIDGSIHAITQENVGAPQTKWVAYDINRIQSWSDSAMIVSDLPILTNCDIYCYFDNAAGHGVEFFDPDTSTLGRFQNVNITVQNTSAKAIETLKGFETYVELNNVLRNTDLGTNITDILAGNRDLNVNDLPQTIYRDRLPFNSNLDTLSAPVLMRGGLSSMTMYPESKINSDITTLQTRLDSTDTWTDVSTGVDLAETVSNLLSWVDTNVSGTTQWEYRARITYNGGENGETSIIVDYSL